MDELSLEKWAGALSGGLRGDEQHTPAHTQREAEVLTLAGGWSKSWATHHSVELISVEVIEFIKAPNLRLIMSCTPTNLTRRLRHARTTTNTLISETSQLGLSTSAPDHEQG